MPFQVRLDHRPRLLARDDRIWVLEDGQGGLVEVWPSRGFNAYRWRTAAGHEVLYRDPRFFQGDSPRRSGWPILFPFPNRIRDGRFVWEGKTYQLDRNDPSGKNAIHGFVSDWSWRVVDQGADEDEAWVRGEVVLGGDGQADWPAIFRLAITYRLRWNMLTVEAEVFNPDDRPLPFGLGYHPYFNLSHFGGEEARLMIHAKEAWELDYCLPTGRIVQASTDLQKGRSLEGLTLDNAFTSFDPSKPVATLDDFNDWEGPCWGLTLTVSPGFRELVVFTPPHRQALCLEPYTCPTDAINLHNQGIACGWQMVPPGGGWSGVVQATIN